MQFYDRKGTAIDAYDAPATSFVVVINKAGKVVYTGLGGTQDNLEAAIRKRSLTRQPSNGASNSSVGGCGSRVW